VIEQHARHPGVFCSHQIDRSQYLYRSKTEVGEVPDRSSHYV
jgi:hypothetical protein